MYNMFDINEKFIQTNNKHTYILLKWIVNVILGRMLLNFMLWNMNII